MAFALALTGTCYAAALVCCGGGWRVLLPASLPLHDAVASYGVGPLANTFLPGRAGDAIRIGLFGRVVPGGVLAVAGSVAAFGATRWLLIVPLGIVGALESSVSALALAAGAAALLPLPLVWLLARGSRRARAVLEPLRSADRDAYLVLAAWVAGTVAARVAAATMVATAFGVPNPVVAALLVVPALELAGVIPLTPANVGVAGGAAALAFHAQGMPLGAALTAGLALHAAETGAGIVVGATSTIALCRRSPLRLPFVTGPLTTVASDFGGFAPGRGLSSVRTG
jgi:uncharacterized membrane protein YbhN (UPF0104 family)